ncbi:MAG: GNAT family N-acetyltransferase [Bacilli bacterium]|nr:GNAT family N-acetyltransferase [Bacilli bacterium]
MNGKVIIETERLLLRQWNLDDVPDLVEGLNNLNVSKWLANVPYPYNEDDAKDFINYSIDNHLFNFAIVLKEENKVIGGVQLSNIDYTNRIAGGGIWINEKYQGKGYGREAFGAKIQYAFETLGLRRLENGYFKDNERSHKMQLSFGYKDEGIKRKKFISKATGTIEDEYITGLLKDEWIK